MGTFFLPLLPRGFKVFSLIHNGIRACLLGFLQMLCMARTMSLGIQLITLAPKPAKHDHELLVNSATAYHSALPCQHKHSPYSDILFLNVILGKAHGLYCLLHAASLLSCSFAAESSTGEVCASELRWRCAHLLSPYPAAFLSGLAVDEEVQYSPMLTHCAFASTPTLLQLRRCSQTWAKDTSHSSIGMSLHGVVSHVVLPTYTSLNLC